MRERVSWVRQGEERAWRQESDLCAHVTIQPKPVFLFDLHFLRECRSWFHTFEGEEIRQRDQMKGKGTLGVTLPLYITKSQAPTERVVITQNRLDKA